MTRRVGIGDLVEVNTPIGTHLGRIVGFENGRNLRKWGGPWRGYWGTTTLYRYVMLDNGTC